MKTKTRRADIEDIPEIGSLYLKELGKEPNEHLINYYIRNYPSAVAYCEEKLIGFLYCDEFAPDILHPINLLVDIAYRGQRVAVLLAEEVYKQAKDTDYTHAIAVNSTLYHESEEYSEIARELYMSFGMMPEISTHNNDTIVFFVELK